MKLHVEGRGHAEDLGADVADAELAERPADEAVAHVVDALRPAGRPCRVSLSLISSFCVSASTR